MSVMIPHKKTTALIVGLLLVDLPVLLAVAVVGWRYGYARTWTTVMDYRMQHPLTLLPSLAMTVFLIRKWIKT
jgi:type III secretory pathway component EscS